MVGCGEVRWSMIECGRLLLSVVQCGEVLCSLKANDRGLWCTARCVGVGWSFVECAGV